MDEELDPIVQDSPRPRRSRRGLGYWAGSMLDSALRATASYIQTIVREFELFFGTALLLVGFLGFESDKYCDGNTADYLSCTRPATYYYFDTLDTVLIVLGVFFILLWCVRVRE